jgi:hypothetical protein
VIMPCRSDTTTTKVSGAGRLLEPLTSAPAIIVRGRSVNYMSALAAVDVAAASAGRTPILPEDTSS